MALGKHPSSFDQLTRTVDQQLLIAFECSHKQTWHRLGSNRELASPTVQCSLHNASPAVQCGLHNASPAVQCSLHNASPTVQCSLHNHDHSWETHRTHTYTHNQAYTTHASNTHTLTHTPGLLASLHLHSAACTRPCSSSSAASSPRTRLASRDRLVAGPA